MARYELNLRDYYRILRRHIIIIVVVAIGLGGMTFTLSPTEPTFRATATVQISRASNLTSLLIQTFYWSPEDNIATQTMLISSQPVLLKVAQAMGDIPPEVGHLEATTDIGYRDFIGNLAGKIQARQVEYSGLVDIIATDSSRDYAIQLATYTANAFKQYNSEKAKEQITEARYYISSKLDTVRRELANAQDSLKVFREKSLPYTFADISSLTPLLDRRRTLSDRLVFLRDQVRRLSSREQMITVGSIFDESAAIPYAEAYNQLSTLIAERDRLLLTYTTGADQVRSLNNRIYDSREQLRSNMQQDVALLLSQIEGIDQIINSYPEDEISMATYNREVELNTELLSVLQTSLQEVQIRDAEVGSEVSIVNYPTRGYADQQSGRGLKTVVGLMLGLMLGIVIAFILETLDTSIGTIEDVEEYLEVPVLAVIPHLDVDKMSAKLIEENPKLEDDPNIGMFARLITQYDPRSPAAEAYRTLRTNLQFATAGTGESMETKNTFVFTSSSLQEGKSTTLTNLAITIAQAGNQVLLLGCNMRRPTIYKSFGLSKEVGMTDVLTGQKPWRECIKGITDMMVGPLSLQNIMSMPGLDNLHIITSGGIPPNPSELLNSPRFGQLIEEARKEYDIVLVDSPPILPVTDAAIVGRQVDWSVLIYQVGKVPRNALRRAKLHLSNVGAHVLGIAMNDVRAEISGYSPYSQYMIKYYGEDTKEKTTLLQKFRDLFKKKSERPEKLGREKKTLLQMIFGRKKEAEIEEKEESAWIDVKYHENHEMEEEEMGEDNESSSGYDFGGLPFSQNSDESPPKNNTIKPDNTLPAFTVFSSKPETEEEESGKDTELEESEEDYDGVIDESPPRSWFSRIPLWQWILLAALIVTLVLSFIFGFWSTNSSSAIALSQEEVPDTPAQIGTSSIDNNDIDNNDLESHYVWSVLIGSYRSAAEAESFIYRLPTIGTYTSSSFWIRSEEVPDKGIWYRVFACKFSDREQCQEAARVLKESGWVSMAMVRSVLP